MGFLAGVPQGVASWVVEVLIVLYVSTIGYGLACEVQDALDRMMNMCTFITQSGVLIYIFLIHK